MDQKTIQAGGMLSGIVLIFTGLLVSPVAVGLARSYPHELWWLGAALCLSCFLMIFGSIQNIRDSRNKEKLANQERARITQELAQQKSFQALETGEVDLQSNPEPTAVPLNPEVLAHWMFTEKEWNQFMVLEKHRRLESSLYEGIGIVILGTIVIMLSREAIFSVALTVSLVIGGIISLLRYYLNINSLGKTLPINNVIITRQSVLINDKLNPYRSDTFWLSKLALKPGKPDVLEFTFAWKNRKKQNVSDELRIPVPTNKREAVQRIMNQILDPGRSGSGLK
jgi:hypothetical protein